MSMKKLLAVLLLMSMFVWIPANVLYAEDPAGAIDTTEENTTDTETGVVRYTMEEFDALSDDAKQDVYLNFPEQLPDDFSPVPYMDVLYPAQEPGE